LRELAPTPEVYLIPVDDLLLDPENPRLAEKGLEDRSPDEILRVLWREMAVDEIALSIAKNGYNQYEPIFAIESPHHELIVIEGNRRLAAVKLLRDPKLRAKVGATDLPTITKAERHLLDDLPVIITTRDEVWHHIGFKHVNGPQEWEPFSKAEYIAKVHNEFGIPLDEIAAKIGDKNFTVRRLYQGYMTLKQAEDTGHFDRTDRTKKHFSFSHLYTGLGYPGIRSFIGMSEALSESPHPVPRSKLKNLGELMQWLYGSEREGRQPVVKSQNPDLKTLDEIVLSPNGVAALRQGLPLSTSLNASRGDERLFREALVSAKLQLEEARGKLLTGFKGERDIVKLADDIAQLASSIREEVHDIAMSPKTKHRRRGDA
jgi:hypothetical protein